jgi:hypothetical protein
LIGPVGACVTTAAPSGTPASAPTRKGHSRAISTLRQTGTKSTIWMSVLQATTSPVICGGSKACSQIAEATSAKAKPEPPAASAPRKAPSQTTARLASVMVKPPIRR